MNKRKRTQIIREILATLLVPAILNIATNTVPDLKNNIVLVASIWFLALLGGAIAITITVRLPTENDTDSEITPDTLDQIREDVSEAEKATKLIREELEDKEIYLDPKELEANLIFWETRNKSLMKTIQIRNIKRNEDRANLVLRFTKSIVLAKSQLGKWKEIIKLAPTGYKFAVELQKWNDAVDIAYEIAWACCKDGDFRRARKWLKKMKKSWEHNKGQPVSDELQAKFLDVEGLIYRDFEGKRPEAQERFQKALAHAEKTNDHLIIWRAATHLGRQEEKAGQLEKAYEHYNQALTSTTRLADPALKFECYQELEDLANRQEKFKEAYGHYKAHLVLAAKPVINNKVEQRLAHKGIAKALKEIFQALPNNTSQEKESCQKKVREAYQHTSKALKLKIEEEGSGTKSISNERYELLNLSVQLADMLLLAD